MAFNWLVVNPFIESQINLKGMKNISVAILSIAGFSAPCEVDMISMW